MIPSGTFLNVQPQERQLRGAIPADLVVAMGQSLYGNSWRGALSKTLGVSRETCARWARGENGMKKEAADKALAEMKLRQEQLTLLIPMFEARLLNAASSDPANDGRTSHP